MEDFSLRRNGIERQGPVVLVVMDGVALGPADEGNAVAAAHTPFLDGLWRDHPTRSLRAHGTAVGLPSDEDMGNSEVGHNALGAGRVFDQGAKLVDRAIAERTVFGGRTWQALVARCRGPRKLHFIGLLSDGNVHSHIDQLCALIREAATAGVEQLCVHPLLDGRDVPATSALTYVDQLEALLSRLNAENPRRDYRIASGGGRMVITMDRYEADWSMVERGWQVHVLGQGPQAPSARAAIEAGRAAHPGVIDQDLPPFVIARDGRARGTVDDGDGVVFFNFRGDRAIEITRAFEAEDVPFRRQRRPDVLYAGMMEYDGDLKLPENYLVDPPHIARTCGEYLARNGVTQFACSETQKFGHVTYFWNGNRSGMFDAAVERYLEVQSDRVPFEQRPWMKAAEITDAVIDALCEQRHRFIRLNYANGDMVGHTGDRRAAMIAVEAVDLSLQRLLAAVQQQRGVLIVTADHGNADEMYERDKKRGSFALDAAGRPRAKTSHTLNPVPFSIADFETARAWSLRDDLAVAGLSHVAATVMTLLGYEPPADYDAPLIRLR